MNLPLKRLQSAMHKSVAVIIVNYNTPVHTANCVNSFITYCDQSLFDIIVVDNGSTDNSCQTLTDKFPDVFFIDNKLNLGFAEGNNIALAYSISNSYEYSLLANSDTLVKENIITALKTHLDLNSHVAAVQPAIYWMHERNKLWNGPGYFNKITGNTLSKTSDEYKSVNGFLKVDWFTGCCVLLRNEVLREIGGFNKQYFLYYEDADLSFRMRSNQYDLHYTTTAKIYHEAGISSKKAGPEGFLNPITHYYIARNHLWFIRTHGNNLLRPINMLYNLGYYLALWLYFKAKKKNAKGIICIKWNKRRALYSAEPWLC